MAKSGKYEEMEALKGKDYGKARQRYSDYVLTDSGHPRKSAVTLAKFWQVTMRSYRSGLPAVVSHEEVWVSWTW